MCLSLLHMNVHAHLAKTRSLIRVCVFCRTCLRASPQILLQSELPYHPGEPLSDQIISSSSRIKKKSCFICWKHFSSLYHSTVTSILLFTPVLSHFLPLILSCQCFSWCGVTYASVSFPFCGCCLTRSTKPNTHSGCPLYNLASNSKDFLESSAKLLGMIFLYFGTLLTCCRYLLSFFLSFLFLPFFLLTDFDSITLLHYYGQFGNCHTCVSVTYYVL